MPNEKTVEKVENKTPKASSKEEVTQAQDFSIPNGMSLQDYIKQEVEKGKKDLELMSRKKSINTIKIGCKLMDTDYKEGAEVFDKEKKPVIDNLTGEAKRYPTRYHATFNFMGGSITTEIKENDYHSLTSNINAEYLCAGYMGEVTNFGRTTVQPIFKQFELLA